MNKRKKLIIYTLSALIAATFIIRLAGLTFSPPGFFCDETSIGYNAYSILMTGKDEKGIAWPVFFKAFGDFKNPVYIYLSAIPIKIFGLDVFSVRLTSALLGIGSILLFIYFLYLIKRDWAFALSGGLIMSLMPWHFQFSRIAFEAISLVFFITLDMVLFTLYLKTKKPIFYLFFVLSMVVTFFAYSIGRLVVPLSALILAIIWREEILKKRIILLISIMSVLLLGLIIVYDRHIDPAGILARPHDVLIIDDNPPTYVALQRFVSNYLSHFSPSFLFQRGDLNYRHSPGVSSMLFTSFFLPLLMGLVYFIKRFKKSKFAAFLVLQFLIFPLAASITIINEGAQATRTIQFVPFAAIIITYGVWELIKLLKEKYRIVLAALLVFALFEGVIFYNYYFTLYPQVAIANFEGGMPEAMQFAFSQKASYYYVSMSVCKYRIEIPFFMKYPPEKFQQSLIFPNARCLDTRKIPNDPIPGSIAVYKAGDFIPHFPNETLLKKISYWKKTVKQEAGSQRELYADKEIDLYYVYRY
ncbi:MAG: hypothetical protein V1690_03950 [Candidatus Moraniibacteriota bacterium]